MTITNGLTDEQTLTFVALADNIYSVC